jgi:hypothetical protein
MQVATILSDLKSLSVCVRYCSGRSTTFADWEQGHEEALNLVNVHRSTSRPTEDAHGQCDSKGTRTSSDGKSDLKRVLNLQRAKDLVDLHYKVKLKYMEEGLDADLQKARDEVMRVQKTMSSKNSA